MKKGRSMEKAVTIKTTQEALDILHTQIGYIRCWIDGFAAHGGKGPHTADALRQVQLLFKEAK